MSETSVHPISNLVSIWSKLENKNKELFSDIRVDNEVIKLLEPYCRDIQKFKGMYMSGFNLKIACAQEAQVSFSFSALPRNMSVDTQMEKIS